MVEVEFRNERVARKRNYPYIGLYINKDKNRIVVLFTRPNTGTCLYSVNNKYIGQHDNNWGEADFNPLVGELVLWNK